MKKYILAALFCAFTVTSLQAVTITFNGHAGNEDLYGNATFNRDSDNAHMTSIKQLLNIDGFKIFKDYYYSNATIVNSGIFNDDNYANNGTDYFQSRVYWTLEESSGAVFDLISMDMAKYSYPTNDPAVLTVVGYLEDGITSISNSFILGSINFSEVVFNWTGLTSVLFRSDRPIIPGKDTVPGTYAIDNIELNVHSSTPEPSSYALMLLGLLGLVAFSRKQRQAAQL